MSAVARSAGHVMVRDHAARVAVERVGEHVDVVSRRGSARPAPRRSGCGRARGCSRAHERDAHAQPRARPVARAPIRVSNSARGPRRVSRREPCRPPRARRRRARPGAIRRARRSRWRRRAPLPWADRRAPGRPCWPSISQSRMPPTSKAAAGTPARAASRPTNPNGSGHVLGTTSRSASRRCLIALVRRDPSGKRHRHAVASADAPRRDARGPPARGRRR